MRKMFSEAGSAPAPANPNSLVRRSLNGPTMGTRWSARFDADPGLDVAALRLALADAVERVDRQMSPWKPESDLNRLNRAAPDEWVSLPSDMMQVLARALEIGRRSAGAFDPAVGDLVDAWGFGSARAQADVDAILRTRDRAMCPAHAWLDLDPELGRARKRAPMQLDLCGIAKGHAVDRMAQVMRDFGVDHALVALDGELHACGAQADGTPWAVALESPQDERRTTHGVIEMADVAIATSGDYRHWVPLGHERVAHTMDGRRNSPVLNDVASVTVLAADCASADAWATALLVLGAGQGLCLAQREGLEVLFLLRRGEHLIEMGLGRFA